VQILNSFAGPGLNKTFKTLKETLKTLNKTVKNIEHKQQGVASPNTFTNQNLMTWFLAAHRLGN
jgi:hypothetical protein